MKAVPEGDYRVVEILQGMIRGTSDRWSTMTSQSSTRAESAADPLRPTILIVDDHDDGRDMLIEYFQAHAYATVAAATTRRAARICRESAPAIVVVDLSLPTLDAACRLIRTIKRRRRGVDPYIVGLNGWGFVQQAVPAILAGCSIVLTKPIDLGVLVTTVTIGFAAHVGGYSAG
jgi:CheY-like chemotaxis protein